MRLITKDRYEIVRLVVITIAHMWMVIALYTLLNRDFGLAYGITFIVVTPIILGIIFVRLLHNIDKREYEE